MRREPAGSKLNLLDVIPLVLAVATPLVLFWPVLCRDHSLAFRDTASFYHPLFQWIEEESGRSELPLWNPQVNFGVPLVGEASSSMFYPGKLLLMLPLDFAWKFKGYVVAHALLASLAAYWAARRFGTSPESAAMAAVSYSCGGAVLFQYCNIVFLVGVGWLPLAFATADTLLSTSNWRAAVALGVVLAMMVLGGDPQMAYHAGLATLGFALFQWRLHRWKFAAAVRMASLLGCAAFTALVLSAVQTFPAAEASAWSERSAYHEPRNIFEAAHMISRRQGGWFLAAEGLFQTPDPDQHAANIYEFSFAPWHLVEYVCPNVSGSYFPQHRRWMSAWPAEPRMWTPSVYLGLLPVVLAIASLKLRLGRSNGVESDSSHNTERQTWLSWCAVLAVLGSFGAFGASWLLQQPLGWFNQEAFAGRSPGAHVGGIYWFCVTFLPAYAQFRYPAKLLTFAALPICMLAAIGFDRLILTSTRWRTVAVILVLVLVSTTIAALWLVIDAQQPASWFARVAAQVPPDPTYGPFDQPGAFQELRVSLVRTMVLSLTLAICLLSRVLHTRQGRLVLVVITVVEICSANASLIATAPSDSWRQRPLMANVLELDNRTNDRLTVRPSVDLERTDPNGWHASSSAQRIEELARADRHAARLNHCLAAPVENVDAVSTQRLADHTWFFRRFAKNDESFWGNYWLMPQNTQHIAGHDAMDPWQPLDSVEFAHVTRLQVFRHRHPFPRAWVVHQVEVLPELKSRDPYDLTSRGRDVVQTSNGTRRDFRHSAVIETNGVFPDLPISSVQSTNAHEECHLVRMEPNQVVVEASLQQPGLLVLADTHFPGWTVEQGPILRTDRIFRGVLLQPGKHTIVFRYRPFWLYFGALISALGWAALSIWAVLQDQILLTLLPKIPKM